MFWTVVNRQYSLCVLVATFLHVFITGTDVNFTVSFRPRQARGSPATISATISNVPDSHFAVSAYLNDALYDNTIGLAEFQTGLESCQNGFLSNPQFRCSSTDENQFKIYTLQVVIDKLQSDYVSILWQVHAALHRVYLNVTDCGNVTLSGVVQDVPANQGYLSTHKFSCIEPHYLPAIAMAICQADATWNLTSFCINVRNKNTNIPMSSTYETPTTEKTTSPNSTTPKCTGNWKPTLHWQNNCAAKNFTCDPESFIVVGVISGIVLIVSVVLYLLHKRHPTEDNEVELELHGGLLA